MKLRVLDLFAGAGGWEVGAQGLGLDVLGVELDPAACQTRDAAGLATLRADIAALDPLDHPCDGLIASPPCQAWSMAGKGGGRRDIEHVVACLLELAAGHDTRREHATKCEDGRSLLVVEPLRWTLALRPEWVALEQVPPVLELWKLYAQLLERVGYQCWTGVLEAERYSVPQTRERAILMASRTGPVCPPEPTHQRYVPGEPQRHDVTLDGEVLPWVSMAEALGGLEGEVPSPAPTVTGGGGGPGGVEVFASREARERARTAMWVNGNQPNAARRAVDEPAPTVCFGRNSAEVRWMRSNFGENPSGGNVPRADTEPAASITGQHGGMDWTYERRGAVRVTLAEASVLQGFDPDYPWQGSRTACFSQIGNAIPPPLARAVLASILDGIPS